MHTTPLRRPRRRSTGPGRVPPSHEEIPVTRRKTAAHANHERWLVSYADFMTLLFAFFVVMFASTQNDKYKAKDVSDSVRQALEHGQFSAAISTVLGRGKHEARKTPWSKENTTERENPNAPPPSPPETHPPDLAKSLDTLQRGLDSDLKNGKLQLRLDARGLIISMRASSLSCSLPFFRSESSPLCKVSSDLARSGGCVSGGLGGGAFGFSRSLVVSLLQGAFRASCFPRPSTVEIAALNWPCSSACRTESDTSLALYLSFCVEANITTKKANSSVMKSA